MGIYDGISLEDLKLRLTTLQATYAQVSTGQQITSLGSGDKRVGFAPVDPKVLERQIAELQQAIAALENPAASRRRGYAVATFQQP